MAGVSCINDFKQCDSAGAKGVQARSFAKAAKFEPVPIVRIALLWCSTCDADNECRASLISNSVIRPGQKGYRHEVSQKQRNSSQSPYRETGRYGERVDIDGRRIVHQ